MWSYDSSLYPLNSYLFFRLESELLSESIQLATEMI